MDLKVFVSSRDSECNECGEKLGHQAWITLVEGQGALCLACADLDHLVFLPAGDAALTRRAGKYSTLAAVVLKWSRARKRYERHVNNRSECTRDIHPKYTTCLHPYCTTLLGVVQTGFRIDRLFRRAVSS